MWPSLFWNLKDRLIALTLAGNLMAPGPRAMALRRASWRGMRAEGRDMANGSGCVVAVTAGHCGTCGW